MLELLPQDTADELIVAELPICTGYLDRTLEIFEKHTQPFLLVGTLANTWSGVNSLPQDEIDLLVRSAKMEVLTEDLTNLGMWEVCENPATTDHHTNTSLINSSATRDVWLRTNIEDPWFRYLRLWPETLYNLSMDCAKVQVPDVLNKGAILLEEEYYRDPHQRFGPRRKSTHPEAILPPLQTRAKLLRLDIPIFVPTIEDHLNALLYQVRAQIDSGMKNGNAPAYHVKNYVRYLYLD